jgi:beta-xylosidase
LPATSLLLAAPVLILLLVIASCAPDRSERRDPELKTFTNPVWETNFPDPFVLRAGAYHAYATNGSGANIQTLRSRDLVEWEQGPDAMPQLAPWVMPGRTWAPEVLAREDGTYVLYYTASSLDDATQCIGRAVSDSPEGPFVDGHEVPFICQIEEGGSIDASPFRDEDGSLYLYWKNDGNAIGVDTHIYAQRLSEDGLELEGEPRRLFRQDAAWEGDLVEAPFMWRREGRYYLFYSANAFASDLYAEGYAVCEGPMGPCEKAPENPILESEGRVAGPGHAHLFEDGAGETWMVYHAWPSDAIGSEIPGRNMWLDRLVWEDGKPVVKGPTKGPQPAPQTGT